MIAELPIAAHFRQIKDALYGLKCPYKPALQKRNKALDSLKLIEDEMAVLRQNIAAKNALLNDLSYSNEAGDCRELDAAFFSGAATTDALPKDVSAAIGNYIAAQAGWESGGGDIRVKGGQADE